MELKGVSYISLCFFFLVFVSSVNGRRILVQLKPDPNDAAASARWLVSQNSWGVLSTISSELGGAPFGNVVSFSDGLPDKGYGTPYFYLTTLDPTARNALKDARSSFTISEFPIGTCGKKDPENPTCAKLTLTGKRMVEDEEIQFHEEYMNAQDPSILHFLLASSDDVSSKQLRDDLMTMLIAGLHETSVAVLTWTVFMKLLLHPVQMKVRNCRAST